MNSDSDAEYEDQNISESMLDKTLDLNSTDVAVSLLAVEYDYSHVFRRWIMGLAAAFLAGSVVQEAAWGALDASCRTARRAGPRCSGWSGVAMGHVLALDSGGGVRW